MTRPFALLNDLARKPERLVAGLMSGTSIDSIDAALCRFTGPGPSVELLHYAEWEHDPEIRTQLRAPGSLGVRALAELHVRIAERFAWAALATIEQAGLAPEDVDLIGSHGQTVYHHSGRAGSPRATLQLGDGDVIAERTGRPVVFDFRARDVAASGEGAPLSPIADPVLFARHAPPTGGDRVVLNLGGIANLTRLAGDPNQVTGFDTGPANAPLDRLARRLTRGESAYDRDGTIARSGRVDPALLQTLLDTDDFLKRSPPKSTGFETYGDAFVDRAVALHGGADADLMATLTEFTARTVADAVLGMSREGYPVAEVVAAGGGAKNCYLMERLRAHLQPISLRHSDEFGVPADAREAMIFAVLADMTLRGVPAVLPPVTGARGPRLLGKLCFP